jgi:hypothetical protein
MQSVTLKVDQVRGCHVVSTIDPHSRILAFLDQGQIISLSLIKTCILRILHIKNTNPLSDKEVSLSC